MTHDETRTFEIYPSIEMKPVRFRNRFGIELAGHLYLPEGYAAKKNAAIIVAGPFGAVKEQAAGLYAQQFASMGDQEFLDREHRWNVILFLDNGRWIDTRIVINDWIVRINHADL